MTLSLVKAASVGQRVYVAWDRCAHIKIGTSISTPRRGGELKVQMIISLPGTELEEHRLRKMWKRYSVGGEWVWPGDGLICWLHAAIDSGEARIECGSPLEAHRLVSEIYARRWQVAA
jgi:hypothetical protein